MDILFSPPFYCVIYFVVTRKLYFFYAGRKATDWGLGFFMVRPSVLLVQWGWHGAADPRRPRQHFSAILDRQEKSECPHSFSNAVRTLAMVPVVGLEPTRYRYQRILSYLLHTEYRRTQPPVEVVDGHQKALPILLFLKLMCKKLRFVCHFRSFQFGRKFWILEGHRRDVTHKRSATAHAVDLSITNTL